jgi:hypothetical protein
MPYYEQYQDGNLFQLLFGIRGKLLEFIKHNFDVGLITRKIIIATTDISCRRFREVITVRTMYNNKNIKKKLLKHGSGKNHGNNVNPVSPVLKYITVRYIKTDWETAAEWISNPCKVDAI